jgi:hypothetical protein
MSTGYAPDGVKIGRSYAALRWGGASQERARLELGLSAPRARELEALFSVRHPGRDGSPMRPAFAQHDAHVAAVAAAGGFPVLRP